MGTITIKGLSFKAFLGVYDAEQEAPQGVSADISLTLDLSKAAASDRLEDTVDYHALCETVTSRCGAYDEAGSPRRYALVERLARDILDACLSSDKRIVKARVRLRKYGAVPNAEYIEVEMGH